ncbi:c-type cytochrome [Elioraea rosea]|uniref:c-type cytochrome n=1 Tax=Elioraea rosea TaxID=2492390 RepID=UPI001315257A|nr:cytochrome c [Elioraea rosea]
MTSVTLGAGAAHATDTQTLRSGQAFYQSACAQCHGIDAKGGGPLANVLTAKPTDLTTMSRRNGGQFPFYEAFKMIEGRTAVPAHGTREMPAWGAILEIEQRGQPQGTSPSTYVYGRISELLVYLESVQQR